MSTANGTSGFLVGRAESDRTPAMELFGHDRKPRSFYRRPSNLGLSENPLPAKTETGLQYEAKPSSRKHIVPKIPDHLRMEGIFEKDSEVKASYRNMSPSRPVINKIPDHLKMEGDFAKASETLAAYDDKKSKRPVIHRLRDHSEEVQPRGSMKERSEYKKNFNQHLKGERAVPDWVNNFSKVTIDGGDKGSR